VLLATLHCWNQDACNHLFHPKCRVEEPSCHCMPTLMDSCPPYLFPGLPLCTTGQIHEEVSLLRGSVNRDAATCLILCRNMTRPDLDWRCCE
jgi:hypothetical protein